MGKARNAAGHLSLWILGNVPQWAFITGMLVLYFKRRHLKRITLAAAILFLSYLPFFWMAAHVQPNTHLYSMAIFSLFLGGIAWSQSGTPPRRNKHLHRCLIPALCVYTIGLMIPSGIMLSQMAIGWPNSKLLNLPGTYGIRVSESEYNVYHPITTFIRQHVPKDEYIYSGV